MVHHKLSSALAQIERSAEWVASKAGVDASGLRKFLRGEGEYGSSKLIAVAKVAGIRLDWLASEWPDWPVPDWAWIPVPPPPDAAPAPAPAATGRLVARREVKRRQSSAASDKQSQAVRSASQSTPDRKSPANKTSRKPA